jgi:uncharacterized protein DUF4304
LMLFTEVRSFLRSRGFTGSGNIFRRKRGPLYDMIGFQENWHNGVTPWHAFFINVGVGSAEIDAACPGHDCQVHPRGGHLLDRRWESVVPDLPYELRFDHTTDMTAFSAELCDGLARTLEETERIDSTAALVRYAVENNLLIQYEKTCCYLAAIDDIETLTTYVALLRDWFGHQDRWTIFSRKISVATGSHALTLRKQGVLDPVD